MQHTIGISDMKISSEPDDILITYSLGSCVGVTIYDPEIGIGAMIHCMLPLAKIDSEKSRKNPFMFVDSGLSTMLQELFNLGAVRKRMIAKLAGASSATRISSGPNVTDGTETFVSKPQICPGIVLASLIGAELFMISFTCQ